MFIDTNGLAVNDGAHILNGQATGEFGRVLEAVRYEPGLLRPFIDKRGEQCVTVNAGTRRNHDTGKDEPVFKTYRTADLRAKNIYSPVWNALTLPKDAWIEIDRRVIMATRQRLRAWADLQAANPRGGFDGMSVTTFEYQAMTDPLTARVDMSPTVEGRNDRPLLNLKSIPLPITHADFFIDERELAVSRRSGRPLDTTLAEAGARRIGEVIEQTTIGTVTGVVYGPNSTSDTRYSNAAGGVYGYTNFPQRVTKIDLTAPTGTNPEAVMTDILEMIETMQGNGFFGPYILYTSTDYSRYLNDDYFRSGSTSAVRSLRERLMEIEGITDIRRLDYLTSGYQLILVQMTSDVAEAINGMDVTTVMWPEMGGMLHKAKIMTIKVPLMKSPYNGISGILHATTA